MNPRGRENLNETPPELTIGTISEVILERPPTYEDALANSKPLNSHYLGQSQYPNCECATSRMQSSSGRKKKRCNNCTRFQNKQHLTMAALRCSDDSIPPSSVSSGESQRKISYIQLDVNQLMLSTSPPKYWELHFNNYLTDAITTRNTLDKTQG